MKPAKNPSIIGIDYETHAVKRQSLFRVCCQSCEVHRFDCREAHEPRGGGPFGPVKETA